MANRDDKFKVVGCPYKQDNPVIYAKKKRLHKPPTLSIIILVLIVIGCLGAELFGTHAPSYMYLIIFLMRLTVIFSLGQIIWGEIFLQ